MPAGCPPSWAPPGWPSRTPAGRRRSGPRCPARPTGPATPSCASAAANRGAPNGPAPTNGASGWCPLSDTRAQHPRPARRRRRLDPVRIEVGARTARLHGLGLADILNEIGSPFMWCPTRGALICPLDRVSDVLAVLEHRHGRTVQLTAVDR